MEVRISRRSLVIVGMILGLAILALIFGTHLLRGKEPHLDEDQTALRNRSDEGAPGTGGRTGNLRITIVYDNNEFDHRLDTAWGFSCLVEGLEKTILFDTGGDGSILLSNMETLGIQPSEIDALVISHVHSDHAGGMADLLRVHSNLTAYLPTSFPERLKDAVTGAGARLVEVAGPLEICSDAYTTGELGASIREQSLVIDTAEGLVVITGCAHPGILHIVQQAKKQLRGEVHLVLGGFHLSGQSSSKIEGIARDIRREGVEKVAPCHCSGDRAREVFEDLYGGDFITAGVGTTIELVDDAPDPGEQEGT
jgi:7,8-dihydropterin-6-yl-methyl-4-(beta-D-ribofuranosyl)aminobenzene 5'-phosphate synthase